MIPRRALAKASSKLPRDFYARSTLIVARQLIGMHLVHQVAGVRRAGRIVETEAYLGPKDLAAHSAHGRTARNAVMFGPPGHAYVYFVYGFWNCVNVVTREEGVPQAVLLRALEPLDGIPLMIQRRGTNRLVDLARGPGRLAAAMGIDRHCDGIDLCAAGELWLAAAPWPRGAIGRSVRVGITREVDRPLRFYEGGNRFVSRPRHIRG